MGTEYKEIVKTITMEAVIKGCVYKDWFGEKDIYIYSIEGNGKIKEELQNIGEELKKVLAVGEYGVREFTVKVTREVQCKDYCEEEPGRVKYSIEELEQEE